MSWVLIKICLSVPAYSFGQSLLTKTKIKTNEQYALIIFESNDFVIKMIHLNVGWLDYGKY